MDADGPDGNGTDTTETRVHNDANELTSIDPDGSGGSGFVQDLTHDKAGNIRQRTLGVTSKIGGGTTLYSMLYTHDAWNRAPAGDRS